MDSETLVSNAFHESYQEGISEVLKKNSLTEKLTSVKNKVYERHYVIRKTRLDNERKRRLKQLLDSSDMLRHEAKLIDLNRQRYWIEVRKRMQPGYDFCYQEAQIRNKEKRLGLNTAPCYLDRKQSYPVRLRSATDTSLTPTIRKARASLVLQDLQKSNKKNQSTSHLSVNIAKSPQITLTVPRTDSNRQKLTTVEKLPCEHDRGNVHCKTNSIVDDQEQNKSRKTEYEQSRPRKNEHELAKSSKYKSSQIKKFPLEHTLKIPSNSKKNGTTFTKSYTFCHETTNVQMNELYDEDCDQLPDHIDLRAHFLGDNTKVKDKGNRVSTDRSLNSNNQHLLEVRTTQRALPEYTIDTIRAEADYINTKVHKFVKDLEVLLHKEDTLKLTQTRIPTQSQDFDQYISTRPISSKVQKFVKDLEVLQHKDDTLELTQSLTPTQSKDFDRSTSIRPTTFNGKVSSMKSSFYTKSATMPDPLSFATNDSSTSNATTKDTIRDTAEDSPAVTETLYSRPRKMKYGWELIKGHPEDSHVRGTCTAEDLFLQALTGIPIRNVLQTPVPLHAASRAMRHTATFKMHKIVEKLIKERTRYQKHVVDELKKQMAEVLKGQDTAGEESPLTEV